MKGLITTTNYEVVRLFREELGIELSDRESEPMCVVVPGGGDISPALYYQENRGANYCQPDKDYHEICHIMAAKLEGVPVFGICRGAQMIHVANGGTLIQDLPNHTRSSAHAVYEKDKFDSPKTTTNSHHHQGIPGSQHYLYQETWLSMQNTVNDQLPKVLPNMIVERFYDRRKRLAGVQWHPEYGMNTASDQRDVFMQDCLKLITA